VHPARHNGIRHHEYGTVAEPSYFMFRRRPRPPSWSSRPGNPGLPRRGFLPEELAKGEVYYNYQMTDGWMEA
jgi:hypothetical protein